MPKNKALLVFENGNQWLDDCCLNKILKFFKKAQIFFLLKDRNWSKNRKTSEKVKKLGNSLNDGWNNYKTDRKKTLLFIFRSNFAFKAFCRTCALTRRSRRRKPSTWWGGSTISSCSTRTETSGRKSQKVCSTES